MRTLTFLLIAGLASPAMAQKEASQYLNRSVYVPIEMHCEENLNNAVLFLSNDKGDELQALTPLPGKRIFQFTYYPTLGRVEPEHTIIKMVGVCSGKETFQYVTITADKIFASRDKVIELDPTGNTARRLRYKIDVRQQPILLKFVCPEAANAKH